MFVFHTFASIRAIFYCIFCLWSRSFSFRPMHGMFPLLSVVCCCWSTWKSIQVFFYIQPVIHFTSVAWTELQIHLTTSISIQTYSWMVSSSLMFFMLRFRHNQGIYSTHWRSETHAVYSRCLITSIDKKTDTHRYIYTYILYNFFWHEL